MNPNRALALVGVPSLATALTLLLAPAAQAATDFDPAAGSYTINTTNLTLTGPGTDITGTDVDGVAVFSFKDVSIGGGVTITATGSLPVQIEAAGSFTLAGTIESNGTNATAAITGANAGGAGGGAGGSGNTAGSSSGNGSTGGKPGTTSTDGAGGGGFGGAGGAGGSNSGAGTGGAGGAAGGSLTTQLQGGSGGAGGDGVGGGGGGGGIELNASSLTISATGSVLANGGNGAAATAGGGSGGGAGGGILLAANTLDVTGTVHANGGAGGDGGTYGGGGGGGGGRVTEAYQTLTAGSTTAKASAGAASTGSPAGAAGTKGSAKTDAVGDAQTTAATLVSSDSATLNGNLNPYGQTMTYQFQYGTTKAYGTTVPGSPASGGKATITTPESVALYGLLTPGTKYHFRIVGYSDGVTLYGADETFKTRVIKPLVTTGRANGVTSTSAKVKGSVTPGGSTTKYYVVYYSVKGKTLETPAKNAGKANNAKSVSVKLGHLTASTWYHYRIVAKDSRGKTRGKWRSFKTKA